MSLVGTMYKISQMFSALTFQQLTAVGHRFLAGAGAPKHVGEELNSACAAVPGPVQLMVDGIVTDQQNRPGVVEPDTVQVKEHNFWRKILIHHFKFGTMYRISQMFSALTFQQLTAAGHRFLAGVGAPEHVGEELNSACAVVPSPVQLIVEGIVTDQPNRPGVVEPDTVQVRELKLLNS